MSYGLDTLQQRTSDYLFHYVHRFFPKVPTPDIVFELLRSKQYDKLTQLFQLCSQIRLQLFEESFFRALIQENDSTLLEIVHQSCYPYNLIPKNLFFAFFSPIESTRLKDLIETQVLRNNELLINLSYLLAHFCFLMGNEELSEFISRAGTKVFFNFQIPEEVSQIIYHNQDESGLFEYFETEEFKSYYNNFNIVNNLAFDAARRNQIDLANKLYQLLAYQDIDRSTLHDVLDIQFEIASQYGDNDYENTFFRFYIERPFDVNLIFSPPRTPLDIARKLHNDEAEQMLLSKGALTAAEVKLRELDKLYTVLRELEE